MSLSKKKFLIGSLLLLVLASAANGCTGWEDGRSGTLKVHQDASFVDKRGVSHPLLSGPASFEFKHGFFGLANPLLNISLADGSQFQVDVPRHARMDRDRISLSPSEIHQSFGIRAEKMRKEVESWPVSDSEICQKSAFCNQIAASGNYEYQFSTACPGQREVVRRARRLREALSIQLIDVNEAEIASFESDSEKEWVNTSEIVRQGVCN